MTALEDFGHEMFDEQRDRALALISQHPEAHRTDLADRLLSMDAESLSRYLDDRAWADSAFARDYRSTRVYGPDATSPEEGLADLKRTAPWLFDASIPEPSDSKYGQDDRMVQTEVDHPLAGPDMTGWQEAS